MGNSFFVGIISWLLPGFGYFSQGKWERGLLVAFAIWAMFIIGILSGGAYYPGFEFKDGALLYLLNAFARFGNGLGWLLTSFFAGTAPADVAARSTFEYGGRFLEVGGLLNFLAIVDSSDILSGRKK